MTEHDYTPPADAIEREARALYEFYWTHWANPAYKWRESMCNEMDVKVWSALAARGLRERHRRESPLVARLEADERVFTENGHRASAACVRDALAAHAAHAALDRESEPPTLRYRISNVAYVNKQHPWCVLDGPGHNAAAIAYCLTEEAATVAMAALNALARERGK